MKLSFKAFSRFKQILFPSQYLYFSYPKSSSVDERADMASFADKGYCSNVSVFAAIKQITTKCAAVPWRLYRVENREKFRRFRAAEARSKLHPKTLRFKEESLEADDEHPINEMLWRPNALQSWTEFIEATIGFKNVMGNSFCYGAKPTSGANAKRIQALYPLHPTQVRINAADWPAPVLSYTYNNRPVPAEDILHLKYFNPELPTMRLGLSPVEVVLQQIIQTNSYGQWNTSLVRNMGQIPGVLRAKVAKLTKPQIQQIKNQFLTQVAGEYNAGLPIVTDMEFDWTPTAFTPKDIDWINGFKLAANLIALAFEIPPELLGDSEHKTYNSMPEAIRYFYYSKIIPELDALRDGFNRWLIPPWEEERTKLWLDYNLEDIPILQEERSAVIERVTKLWTSGIVTLNQALEKLGEPDIGPEGDVRLLPLGAQPIAPGELVGEQPEEEVEKAVEFLRSRGIAEFGGNGEDKAKPQDHPLVLRLDSFEKSFSERLAEVKDEMTQEVGRLKGSLSRSIEAVAESVAERREPEEPVNVHVEVKNEQRPIDRRITLERQEGGVYVATVKDKED